MGAMTTGQGARNCEGEGGKPTRRLHLRGRRASPGRFEPPAAGRTPIERMRGPQAGVTPGPNPGPPCAFERSMIVDGWQFTLRYRSSLRSSSTHGPSDPPPRVVSFASVFRGPLAGRYGKS